MNRLCMLLAVLAVVSSAGATGAGESGAWRDDFYPYRVRLALDRPVSGQTNLKITSRQLLDALRPVCVDVLSEETLALDKASLVDPVTGKTVGGYRLIPSGQALDIDGSFAGLAAGKSSKWTGNGVEGISFEPVDTGAAKFTALVVSGTELANREIGQDLELTPGQLYLLSYWICSEATKENLYVSLHNPAKRLFNEVPCSYYSKITPMGQWVRQLVLYRPETAKCRLRIATGLVGRARVGDISLQPVEWSLVANLPEVRDSLDLYVVLLAGHRFVQPSESIYTADHPSNIAAVKQLTAEAADLNPDGIRVDAGDGVRIWSLPSYLPLRAETIRASEPRNPASAIRATLLRGQSTTIVLALDTGTPQVSFRQASCDLPFSARFDRVAAIPVFDSFFPRGKKVETRYDAMVDLNFELAPPDENGIRIVTCTLTAPVDARPGTASGKLRLEVQTQEPVAKQIDLPVQVTVLEPLIKPMRHFGTLFGGQQFTVRYPKMPDLWVRETVTIADFHGYGRDIPSDIWVARLSLPDRPDPRKAPIRDLARKYYHRMLDFNLVPQSMTLFSDYTYKVKDNGEGKAPTLTDWNFTEYDKAIDELVIARDAPWLNVWHANGHNMDMFLLSDGVIYAPRARPADYSEPYDWKQISYEQYLSLVASYFENVAAHLESKGVLDRAIIAMDESDESTYQLMHDVKLAMGKQPHAGRIKWGHTTYKTTVYTQKLPDGTLLMDELLDVPMPMNDEHFNFFEQEWMSRFKRPGKHPWVYYVETDHFNINYAGLSTLVTPLKLRHFGVQGWYNWASFLWSYPTPDYNLMGPEYPNGPTVNPWLNPYYHHGHGMLCFFYPPDPRGPVDKPTDRIIPSYRLVLMREGIQDAAMLDVLERGEDDAGDAVRADRSTAAAARAQLDRMWPQNPVQWYLSYDSYRRARALAYSPSRQQ